MITYFESETENVLGTAVEWLRLVFTGDGIGVGVVVGVVSASD